MLLDLVIGLIGTSSGSFDNTCWLLLGSFFTFQSLSVEREVRKYLKYEMREKEIGQVYSNLKKTNLCVNRFILKKKNPWRSFGFFILLEKKNPTLERFFDSANWKVFEAKNRFNTVMMYFKCLHVKTTFVFFLKKKKRVLKI